VSAEEAKEFSAGGIVTRKGEVLLVQVQTLLGEKVWSYPKGHVESGETPEAAALREVHEETGWECEILGPIKETHYTFYRGPKFVRKRVQWYWMKALKESGKPDADEVSAVQWCKFDEARELLHYPDDWGLLEAARHSEKESRRWG
jgi:diadenosine hexaphosphate hydrolase (ATP-forming)